MQDETIDRSNSLKYLENRIARLKRRAQQLEGISHKHWIVRRVIFVCGILLALLFCKYSGQTAGWILASSFVAVFCMVAVNHRRVRDSITRHSLMLNIKQNQVARVDLDWDKMPPSDQSEPERGHAFETDLDITGARSLHRLLDSAVTREGSRRLRSWLLATTPDLLIIKRRQSLVKELKGYSLFRDKLHLYSAIASGGSKPQWDSSILVDWMQYGVRKESLLSTVRLLSILAGVNIALAILGGFVFAPQVWPIAFFIYLVVMILKRSQIATAWGELQELEKALRRFRVVFQCLESRGYKNRPGLAELCSPFVDGRKRPSAELKRAERIASALGLRTNPVLWLLVHVFIPWDFYFTYRLEFLKKDIAHLLPIWLDAWYEIEALNSLANFAYLNPRYVFPEIVLEWTLFDARALGHPLIKPEIKICNDFEIGEHHKIVVLTGSNMAGKSTFVRTVGVNLCLGYAGAPVNADCLRVSLFRVFTCIQVDDSVQDGLSYFYAEVKRLKALLSATEQDDMPVLFLIDEIYRGTNNRERHIGGRAFIRALSSSRTTVGIVATHDLELATLADEIPGIANFHFREEVYDGRMVFDYLLRPGPCPTTNALMIMQIEGLPVDL
jgi:MutS domain V